MEKYELILQIINTVFSGISILFIIFGWIIPYKQSQKQQLNQNKYEESIQIKQYNKEKIDEQVSNLYVPLYTLSLENKMQFNILLKQLRRNHVFPNGKSISDLEENEKTLWIHFLNNIFVPNLNKMKNILNQNIHLIFEPEIPSSYQRFMEYTIQLNNDLEIYLSSTNNCYGDLFVKGNYPTDFDIYINKTLNKLLQIQRSFVIQDENFTISQNIFDQNIFDQNISNDNLLGETAVLANDYDTVPYLFNPLTNEKIIISSHQFVIGKDNSCNYKINNNFVSRKHLMLVKENEVWYIIDFNATNGTYLNNSRLSPNSKILLKNGDKIGISNIIYYFHL